MTEVYEAADPIEAELVCGYLSEHGVDAYVTGAMAWGGVGELAANAYPRVHVRQAADEARARELLRQYERRAQIPWQWRCQCGEASPEHFEVCWSCGADKPNS